MGARTVTGTGEEPDYQSQQGEQRHKQNPNYLVAGATVTLNDVDDGPDITGQDQQTKQARIFHIPSTCSKYSSPGYYKPDPANLKAWWSKFDHAMTTMAWCRYPG
jgi:hypothetical protein